MFLCLFFLLFAQEQELKIERILNKNSKPEERIEIAKKYKDVDIEIKEPLKILIKTNKGEFLCELYPQYAPKTVKNFVKLSKLGFYDGLIFHRYVPDFVIQGGDPYGTGYGNAGYNIPLEINEKAKHVEGALGIARAQDPNSGSCQFYITLKETPHLDGNYTVFGKVIKGMDVVKKLRKGDIIEKIEIMEDTQKIKMKEKVKNVEK
ncbi:MAG: peptidylprolyl isomerase [candidate division WOR-3 bacterium]|uniref:Peptidyl-prolyl cis-trans isomerase n=2 Tax=candidate division WOR-3 bacterium TaxID=2052148 RepID=A0A7V3ZT92_UNCW3